eukprot:scaffold1193_cov163-Pinguiococcus_pyrenoidosus.AAC.2
MECCSYLDLSKPEGSRTALALTVLFATPIRPDNALATGSQHATRAFRMCDVIIKADSLLISLIYAKNRQHGEGAQHHISMRGVPQDSPWNLIPRFQAQMATLRAAGYAETTPFFTVPETGHLLHRDDIDKAIKTWAKHTGRRGRYSPYSIKHGSVTAMAAAGVPGDTIDHAGNWAPGQGNYRPYLHASNPQQKGVYAKMLHAFDEEQTPSQTFEQLRRHNAKKG